jgi:hypothetical protein
MIDGSPIVGVATFGTEEREDGQSGSDVDHSHRR